ncbi:GNG12 [Branchiostoma lanceolatum]|uniref:GNG12 protein n=1 Tax=Branchiostoma lanceolatum TaxID=7740 RepID=A0A8J9YYY1_BRALA|nr:GNG12 [Branchiostoma lanceolatum]
MVVDNREAIRGALSAVGSLKPPILSSRVRLKCPPTVPFSREVRPGTQTSDKAELENTAALLKCEDMFHYGVPRAKSHATKGAVFRFWLFPAELENTAALLKCEDMFQSREEQDLYEAEQELSQLQYEAKNTRREMVSVSVCAADLQKYVENHQKKDPLVVGVPNSKNPFVDKKGCCIL